MDAYLGTTRLKGCFVKGLGESPTVVPVPFAKRLFLFLFSERVEVAVRYAAHNMVGRQVG